MQPVSLPLQIDDSKRPYVLLVIGEYIWNQEVIPPEEQWKTGAENVRRLGDYAGKLGLKLFDMPIPATPEQCHMGWHHELSGDPAHSWLRETIKEIGAPYR